jgi:hypothetical protein
MAKLWVTLDFVDATRDMRYDHSGLEPTDFEEEEAGKLYHALRREYGRCVSKVYMTTRTEEAVPIGWVFQKKEEYTDTNRKYLRETWVTVHLGPQRFRLDRRRKRHDKRAEEDQRHAGD